MEKDLKKLLQSLDPELQPDEYVFVTVAQSFKVEEFDVLGSFVEKEGKTLILKKEVADKLNLKYQYIARWITLNVHSALEAVGLTAAFSKALADVDISCNVVAGYHHDHIFVQSGQAEMAMDILHNLGKEN